MRCSVAPITPWASIIQNSTSEPISGVTIIGSSEKKITGPLSSFGTQLTATRDHKAEGDHQRRDDDRCRRW